MPKELFFKISEEKRNKLTNVCKSEFKEKSFDHVSVNTIIKKAGISRGSFYTYFDDLEECFSFIVRDIRDKRFKYGYKLLNDANNDYFSLVRKLYEYDYDLYKEGGEYSLFKNYIYFMQSNQHGNLRNNMIIDLIKKLREDDVDFEELFSIKKLNMTSEQFFDLVEVVILIMINTFLKAENENLSKEDSIKLFNQRLDLIEYGVRSK